jgi:hypothetical protein
MVDGALPLQPPFMTRSAATPEDGRQIVRDIKWDGYDYVKVYGNLPLDTFSAIVDEASKQHIKVLGHIAGLGVTDRSAPPTRRNTPVDPFFQPGFSMVAHAEEFAREGMNYADIPHYVELAKRNGSWLTSTLLLNERILAQTRDISMLGELPGIQYLHPVARPLWFDLNRYASRKSPERIAHLERQVEFTRRLTKAFVDAGVPVVAGTDTPLPGLVPGFALHGELEALARAGLTNVQILAATTRLPAEWLGVLDDRGTVEAGKRADLLLLDADPTVDIANTHKIAAIIVGGHYLSRKELDRMLATVAEHYAEMPVFKAKPYGSDGPKR